MQLNARFQIFRLLALLLLTLALPAHLQSYSLPFKNFSIQSGLSQSVVNTIYQDSGGYLWAGTEYGLNRFNMFDFVHFYSKDGLSANNILSIYELRDRRLLVGTDSGLDVMDGNRFRRLPGTEILAGASVVALFQDSREGLWVGTSGRGLYLFRDDVFQHYHSGNGLADDIVRRVIELNDGRIAVATRGGVSVIDPETRQVMVNYTESDGLSERRTRDIMQHQDGSIWVATRNGITIVRDGEVSYLNVANGLIHPRVTALKEDPFGGIWITTEGGVSHYQNAQFLNYTDNNGLSNNIVTSLILDHEDNIWFGTYGGGMDLLTGEKFRHYTVQQGLLSNMITSFATDGAGQTWIGTYGGGIARVGTDRVSTLTTANNLIDNRVYTMTSDRDGRIWIGTRNGVSLLQNGVIFPGNQFPDLPDRKVRSILEASNGDLWVATYGGGIARYRGGVLQSVYNTENGLPDNIVMNLIESGDGEIWAATYGGVAIIGNRGIRVLSIEDGLVQNAVMSLYEDKIGQIWIGTFGGISIWNAGRIRNITTTDGLPNAVAYFITEDARGYIWIGSNNGLIRYDTSLDEDFQDPERVRDELRFKRYSTESGLSSNEMNANAVYTDRNGNFWMGTVAGANYFQWQLETVNRVGPPVHIESVNLFEQPITSEELIFSHEENFIGFDFVGISFGNPSAVVYEYRLRGVDQTWQRTTQRSVRYTTLPDGLYRFEVRARNADGYWSRQAASVTFRIEPPFWKTWWFMLIILLALSLVAAFIWNYFRVSRMVDLERIRIRIASDLHDDVGASLTEIALQTDFLQATQKDDKVVESLRQVGEMSRRIVTTMDDIVWSIDARNDTYGDLLDRMQDYATNVLLPKDIVPHFEFKGVESDKIMPLEFRQNLYLIFKEAVNNAAKHSDATRIDIRLEIAEPEYLLVIADNGKGLPEKIRSGGHGLKNMKLRARRIGAQIDFQSEEGLTITITGRGL